MPCNNKMLDFDYQITYKGRGYLMKFLRCDCVNNLRGYWIQIVYRGDKLIFDILRPLMNNMF